MGIEDESVLRIESAIIDLIGIDNLTNKQQGFKSAEFGRMTIQQIIAAYSKQPVNVDENAILIRLNQKLRYSLTPLELYDYTRGYWVLNIDRAKAAKYAFAIYNGIIQEVYEIKTWLNAGETFSCRNDEIIEKGRKEFIGNLAPQSIRDQYKFKSVEHYFLKGNANSIMYLNC